jgi:hypothetical protein
MQNLSGPDGAATSLGRLTGLIASDLLLLQVLLMARMPWVERSYGQDTLGRRHRLVGFASFWLMVAHVVLITVGYAQAGDGGVVGEAWTLVVTYPGMLLAAAGTGLLVLVVVSSIRAARRRQRYGPGTSSTCTPTSASGSRSRISCGPVPTSSPPFPPRSTGGRPTARHSAQCWCSGSHCRSGGRPTTGCE